MINNDGWEPAETWADMILRKRSDGSYDITYQFDYVISDEPSDEMPDPIGGTCGDQS